MQGLSELLQWDLVSATTRRASKPDSHSEGQAVIRIEDGCVSLVHGVHGVLPTHDACISHSRLLEDMLSSSNQSTDSSIPITEDAFVSWMEVVSEGSSDAVPGNSSKMPLTVSSMVELLMVRLIR